MKRLLALNTNGRLTLRAGNGAETFVETIRPNVLLLMDTSGSMTGTKLNLAKSGAIEFAHSAIARGYSTALAIFADRAAMVCDPTPDAAHFTAKISALRVGLVGANTDLSSGLILANKFRQLATVVVVTDGATLQEAALRAADILKGRHIEIICIGTDDADRDFLQRLATRTDLATHVPSKDLALAVRGASYLMKASHER